MSAIQGEIMNKRLIITSLLLCSITMNAAKPDASQDSFKDRFKKKVDNVVTLVRKYKVTTVWTGAVVLMLLETAYRKTDIQQTKRSLNGWFDRMFPTVCPVCEKNITSNELRADPLPCGHSTFHQHCMNNWRDRETTAGRGHQCPVCTRGYNPRR